VPEYPGQLPLFGPAPEPEPSLDALRAENAATYERLRVMGAVPNPGNVLGMRLELVIDALFNSAAERHQFDLAFETNMREMLAEISQQVVAAKLTPSAAPPGTLLLPR